jgi:hypothetical protein
MMTKAKLKVFALLVILSAVGAMSGIAREDAGTTLRSIARYRDWTPATIKPVQVDPSKISVVVADFSKVKPGNIAPI